MKIEELKRNLLNIGLVVDNNYLDKYCSLIVNNEFTLKEKYKTQCHHIIPRYYFKLNKLKLDNSQNNLVNLSHVDHFWAHYYLALCSTEKYKYQSECTVSRALKCNVHNIDWQTINQKADKIQQITEDFKHRDSEFKKGKPNLKLRGKLKNRVFSQETRQKLSESWSKLPENRKEKIRQERSKKMKGRIVSELTKQKITKAKTGQKYNKIDIVYCYNIITLNLFKQFNNITETSKYFNKNNKLISEYIYEGILFQKKYILTKSPMTEEQLKTLASILLNKKRKPINRYTPVYCLNLTTKEITHYNNPKEAANILNINYGCLTTCMAAHRNYKGYYFSRTPIKEDQSNAIIKNY